ncbi:HAMP domain-containing protein [Pseudonocardia broussonetiae]|uniref:HAMP domain-containing protein n=1 Tax=Pseudonocardia broussonetiae TaxID=2736640 RepID=A0A6M6JC21_9PSEU|nr:HAMP domain-containing protein [Pseudonocardia broussonetiae]QJY45116.1 HAMP domain-containing protein [Pseudonocardia broussonetiae]
MVLLLAAVSLITLQVPGASAPGGSVGPAGWPGLVPGIVVAVVAVGVFLALWALLVRPVQRLRRDVNAARHGGSIHRSGIGEVDRVAVALRAHGARAGHAKERTRRRPSLRVGLAVLTVALLGWLGTAFLMVSRGHTATVADLVTDGRHDAADTAADLRHTLAEGLSGLQAIAGSTPSGSIGDLRTAAAGALGARPVFGAVHVVDRAGSSVVGVGGNLSLSGPPPEAGIRQLNFSGPEPIVVASAPIGDGPYTLVAQYDVRALNAVVDRAGAPTRVFDADLRTVLSNEGYQAFTELTDPALRAAAMRAFADGPTTTTQVIDGTPSAVASYRIGFNDDAAALNWVVLRNQSLAAAGFAQDPTDRAAVVIVGVSAGVALMVLAWIYIAAVRPLRDLGDHAEAIAAMLDGAPAPEPVAPQRIDEIGAIAAALNRSLVVVTRAPLEETQILPAIGPRPAIPHQSRSSPRGPSPRSGPAPLRLGPEAGMTAVLPDRNAAGPNSRSLTRAGAS